MDETAPLLAGSQDPSKHVKEDEIIVDFDPNGDPENPLDWPTAYKWGLVALMAFSAFTVTFTCIAVVPIASKIAYDLDGGRPSKSASVLFVTIWELGEAAGPLLIAPLSELYGRAPVMNVAGCFFVAATAMAALSQTSPMFILARALTGLVVTANVLNPAIVGDIFPPEQRGAAMSIIALAPLTGGVVGPVFGGAMADTRGWRETVWVCAILAIICEILILTLFRETYKVVILRRRADRIRRETGLSAVRTEQDSTSNPQSQFWESVTRPSAVFFGSGVLQIISLFSSVVFTYFYVYSTTLPDILEEIYHLSGADTGLAFIAFSFGSTIGVIVCHRLLDRIYLKMSEANKGVGQPEFRLPLAIVGGFLLPFSVAGYGWVAQLQLHLSFMILSVALIGFTLMLAFLPITSYVVDSFGVYSASAMTAVIVTRCLMGTFLPIATGYMAEEMGYGYAFTVFMVMSLCLAPIPVLVLRYGVKWRQASKYSRNE